MFKKLWNFLFPPIVVGESLVRTCVFCRKRVVLSPGRGITVIREGIRTVPPDCGCEVHMIKEAKAMRPPVST